MLIAQNRIIARLTALGHDSVDAEHVIAWLTRDAHSGYSQMDVSEPRDLDSRYLIICLGWKTLLPEIESQVVKRKAFRIAKERKRIVNKGKDDFAVAYVTYVKQMDTRQWALMSWAVEAVEFSNVQALVTDPSSSPVSDGALAEVMQAMLALVEAWTLQKSHP